MVRMALDICGVPRQIGPFLQRLVESRLILINGASAPLQWLLNTPKSICPRCSQSCRSATKNALAFRALGVEGFCRQAELRRPWVRDAVPRLSDPFRHDGSGPGVGDRGAGRWRLAAPRREQY